MASDIECNGKLHRVLTLSDTGSTIAFLLCAGISWHHQQEIPGHFLMPNNEPEVAKDISPWVTIMT